MFENIYQDPQLPPVQIVDKVIKLSAMDGVIYAKVQIHKESKIAKPRFKKLLNHNFVKEETIDVELKNWLKIEGVTYKLAKDINEEGNGCNT